VKRLGEGCEDVDREVLPQGWGGNFCPPIKGEVDRGEALRKLPGRVLGPDGGQRGEGLRESGRGGVGVWGRAGHSEGG